jgi:hypothetical protein
MNFGYRFEILNIARAEVQRSQRWCVYICSDLIAFGASYMRAETQTLCIRLWFVLLDDFFDAKQEESVP